MTILLEDYGRLPTVVEGFAKHLEFLFRLYHSEGDSVSYQPLGGYDIAVYLVNPGAEKSFLGHGYLANTEPLVQPIQSRPNANRETPWVIHVGVSAETIGLIDASRRLCSSEQVQFQFEWGLLAQQWKRTPQGPQPDGAPSRHRVSQETEGGARPPLISVPIQEWFKITEAYGFPQRRFLELVFPEVDRDRWQQAAADLAHADRDFDLRNDKQVIDYCEQALENVLGRQIVTARSEEKAKEEVGRLLEDWGMLDERKREMVVEIIYSTVVFVRRVKHSANAAGYPKFDPTSGDAEFSLLKTKSLLGYLSKLQTR